MDPESTEQKLERAIRLHNDGKLDDAEAIYRDVLRQSPGHPVALHLSGLIAHQRGRHREAVTLIEMALAGGSNHPAVHNNCGVAYRALGDLYNANRHFAQALALDPEFADAHLNYALLSMDQGLMRQAAVHFEFVVELRGDIPKASFCLGRIYLEEGKPALAAERLRSGLQLQPENVEAHYLLGRSLLALGDTRASLQSLAAALQLQPEHGAASHLAAKVSFELCHENASVAYLERAQRFLPALRSGVGARVGRARIGQIEPWCGVNGNGYVRLARRQWLRFAQPRALAETESPHFQQPEPFSPEIFLARVTQARVLPKDLLLLSADGQLFLNGFVNNPLQYASREDGRIWHCADDGRLLLALPERSVAMEQPCVLLGAASSHFLWIFEFLARLWAVQQQPVLQALPLLVQQGLTRWQDELLQLLGYGPERRVAVPADAMLECRELHAASLVSTGHFIAPVAIHYLRRELARCIAPAADGPRRIYLSRRHLAARRLSNEAELLPLLEQHGFTVVHPETLSAAGQLALFQSAEVILGVEGAAMINLLVAPAQARVGVIVARGWYQPQYYYVSAPIGHDFTYLTAEPDYSSHSNVSECDVALPRERLEAFLARL